MNVILEKIKSIIVDMDVPRFRKETEEDFSIRKTIDLDSTDYFEFMMKIEEEFGIEMATDDKKYIVTFKNLIDLIKSKTD